MRSGQDFIRSPKLSPADAIELAIFFASTPITHFLTVLGPQNLAGAEGFEPPSSVLETDSLTVELTPLCSAGALARVSLLHFLVRLVLAASGTELLQFDTVRCRLAVLGRRIVPLFALTTLQRNDLSGHCQLQSCL